MIHIVTVPRELNYLAVPLDRLPTINTGSSVGFEFQLERLQDLNYQSRTRTCEFVVEPLRQIEIATLLREKRLRTQSKIKLYVDADRGFRAGRFRVYRAATLIV